MKLSNLRALAGDLWSRDISVDDFMDAMETEAGRAYDEGFHEFPMIKLEEDDD